MSSPRGIRARRNRRGERLVPIPIPDALQENHHEENYSKNDSNSEVVL